MAEKLILLVDDHPDIIRILGKQLKEDFPNYSIIIATNGQKACEVAIKRLPDLIVMDWEMPELSGVEATRQLQTQHETAGIPIIIATGRMTSSEDLKVALDAGAIDYVRKPIDFVELSARIRTAFRIKEQEETIKRLLQNEIDLKTRQLTSSSMLVVEKGNMLQNYVESLESIEQQLQHGLQEQFNSPIEEGIKNIQKLRKTVRGQLRLNDSWLDFKTHFEEVHPTFFKKLVAIHGEMSSKDLKLCAYMRLGMEVKEMANLLNITPSSIRTAIYRLKKKMQPDTEENFRDFIAKLS